MGTGRYGGRGGKNSAANIWHDLDKSLKKISDSKFMAEMHSKNPKERGLNAMYNANPGNYTGPDVEPDLVDYIDKKTNTLDFEQYDADKAAWKEYMKTHNLDRPEYADIDSYQINCQRCVIAMEANYRGADVEALPAFDGDDDYLPTVNHDRNFLAAFRDKNTGEKVEPIYNKHFYDMPGFYNKSDGIVGNMFRDEAKAAMLKEGNGARFVIDFSRRASTSGHTFFAEVVGKKIVVYEPQYATTANLIHYVNSNTSRLRITRVDNTTLDQDILNKAVVRHSKRRHTKHGGTYSSRK